MSITIKRVSRIIYYYELICEFQDAFEAEDDDHFRELFRIIVKLAKSRSNNRYQQFGDRYIFIQEIQFNPTEKTIQGKLRSVRKDILPELMDTDTDLTRDIDAKEQEGVVETTHFVIDYSKKKKKVALEFNHFGAKISDLVSYLRIIGALKKATKEVTAIPITKDTLKKFKERINRCSEFTVKVHRDKLSEVKKMDEGVWSAIKVSQRLFKAEYATLTLKFDYKKKAETRSITGSIMNLINSLVSDKGNVEVFDILKVRAEDADKRNRLETFDLLIDKVKSTVKVERKPKSRIVVSADMFEKIKEELIKNRI